MTEIIRLKGIIPPLITPLNELGDVCEESVRNLIEYVHPYSSALLPLLTTGEGWKLSKKQWINMLEYTLKYSKGIPVVAGAEFPSTDQVIEYSLIARNLGVNAIVVTTPFHQDLKQNQIFDHFYEIAATVDMPIIIYHEQGFSKNTIELETMIKICKFKNVVGIKEASGDVVFTNKLIVSVQVPVFQGWEHLAFATQNPAGYIFPLANLEPQICWKMYTHPSANIQHQLDELCKKYDINDVAPSQNIKIHLKDKGIILTQL